MKYTAYSTRMTSQSLYQRVEWFEVKAVQIHRAASTAAPAASAQRPMENHGSVRHVRAPVRPMSRDEPVSSIW